MKKGRGKMPLVVAHRGASGIAPENTMAAFRRAISQGADMVELDIRMTKDFHIVVHHDREIGRTTGGKGAIWDLTLQQLRTYDAGSWFHQRFAGQQIPTLRQVLEVIPPNMGINIEAKTDGDPRQKLAFEEVCILIIMEKKAEDRVIVSSFDHHFLERMHKLHPGIRTGSLSMPVRDARKKPSTLSRKLGTSAFICSRSMITPELVKDAHTRKLMVGSYVINTRDHLQEAIDLGIDAIVTDYPGRIIPLLKKMGLRSGTRKVSAK